MRATVAAVTYQAGRRKMTRYAREAAMEIQAMSLARSEMTRWRRQAWRGGPKTRCERSHVSRRGDAREKAHSARSMKGVVGRIGRNAPATPRPKNAQPSAR